MMGICQEDTEVNVLTSWAIQVVALLKVIFFSRVNVIKGIVVENMELSCYHYKNKRLGRQRHVPKFSKIF